MAAVPPHLLNRCLKFLFSDSSRSDCPSPAFVAPSAISIILPSIKGRGLNQPRSLLTFTPAVDWSKLWSFFLLLFFNLLLIHV